MSARFHFAGISGSLRKDSFNTKLIKAVAQLLPDDVSMEIISFADVPVYNGDYDLPIAQKRPQTVEVFRESLRQADALVIASPEYNYGIPGGLKNAIDWASRAEDSPLLNKPIALMGATPGRWGTSRMQYSFLSLFLYLN